MTAEERFKEMISGMVIHSIQFPDMIRYYKNGKYLIRQDVKTGVCWINYWEIWSILESEYGLNYQQVRELTTTILKQHLKYGVDTTVDVYSRIYINLKQHLKYGVDTTKIQIG